MKTVKYQTQRVTIAVGNYTDDHIESEKLDLDTDYDRVTGVSVHRVLDSGVANGDYSIGIRNDKLGEIHELTHIGGWATAADDGTNPDERFKTFNFEVKGGKQLDCRVKLPTQNLATALIVEFVIRLEKDYRRTA